MKVAIERPEGQLAVGEEVPKLEPNLPLSPR